MLALRTRHAHEALHVHPWIASLLRPDLTINEYCTLLGAYHSFYEHVQQASATNRSIPASLSLALATERLQQDLECLSHLHHEKPRIAIDLTVSDSAEQLGALYVLHGARFGAAILNKSVRQSLPDAPRHFLDSGTTLETWQLLIKELELLRHDYLAQRKLINSAIGTFRAFGTHITRYCESRPVSMRISG